MKINIEIDTGEDLQMVAERLRNLAYSFEPEHLTDHVGLPNPPEADDNQLIIKEPSAPPTPANRWEIEKVGMTDPEPIPGIDIPAPVTIIPEELDSRGLPWDERIHSANKTFLAKTGEWKNKRGISKEIVESVERELRGESSAPTMPMAVAPEKPVAVAPPPPPPASAPVAAQSAEMLNFKSLLDRVTAERVSKETIDRVCANHGIPTLNLLIVRPDLLPAVNREFFPNG